MTRRMVGGAALVLALALGAFAARDALYGVSSLVLANWNRDLRDRFVGYGDLVQPVDAAAFARTATLVRADGPYQLWRSRIGDFWIPESEGPLALAEMARVVENDPYEYRGRGVRRGDVVIDGGAHLGSFVRRALQQGAELVVAIEPSSAKIECLRRTFAADIAAGRVRLVRLALWNADDKLWLAGLPTMASTVDAPAARPGVDGEWVDVTTLDKIVAAEKLDRVDFVKMDIEGAEVNALAGAAETIRRFRPFLAIAVEHTDDLAANARAVIRTVDGLRAGYRKGFGRYGKILKRAAYTPWEIFFFDGITSTTRAPD